jgi:hypothetical protein
MRQSEQEGKNKMRHAASYTVTIQDSQTGETKVIVERLCIEPGDTVNWWRYGNGGCDCNRGLVFGLPEDESPCSGSDNRFRVLELDFGDHKVTDDLNDW